MGKSSESKVTQISKQLTQLLRHSGRAQGLQIRSDGFAPLRDVLNHASLVKLKATEHIVREIVRTSDKQRFGLIAEDNQLMIRANQGHSMDGINMDELCGSPIYELRPGEVCCHGTYERHLQSIIKDGLKAGGNMGQAHRKDVHFSVKRPGETVVSGMRQSCQVVVYLDLPRAARDGLRFYRSENDVILCAGISGTIPPAYIESIWDIKKQVQVYPSSSSHCRAVEKIAFGLALDELHNAVFSYTHYCTVRGCGLNTI